MYSRKHLPGEVRPARPALCCALALLTGVTTRADMPVLGLYEFCLQKPGSITYCSPPKHPKAGPLDGFSPPREIGLTPVPTAFPHTSGVTHQWCDTTSPRGGRFAQ